MDKDYKVLPAASWLETRSLQELVDLLELVSEDSRGFSEVVEQMKRCVSDMDLSTMKFQVEQLHNWDLPTRPDTVHSVRTKLDLLTGLKLWLEERDRQSAEKC
jgi:hypothetical protein